PGRNQQKILCAQEVVNRATPCRTCAYVLEVAAVHRGALVPVTLLVALGAAGEAWGAPRIVKGPYLQDVAPDGASIRVELDTAAPLAVEVTTPGKSGPPATFASKEAASFHAVRVDKLEPATRYDYVVKVANGTTSPKGTLTTAPRTDAGGPFSFIIYGDNRS